MNCMTEVEGSIALAVIWTWGTAVQFQSAFMGLLCRLKVALTLCASFSAFISRISGFSCSSNVASSDCQTSEARSLLFEFKNSTRSLDRGEQHHDFRTGFRARNLQFDMRLWSKNEVS